MHPVSHFKKHTQLLWYTLWVIFLLPFIFLLCNYFNKTLGINPLQSIERTTGNTALIFLIITLCITPARFCFAKLCTKLDCREGRRLADWNWLMRTRRMIGMYCFFYAAIHAGIYFYFDLALEWEWLISDIEEKPYILAGMLTMLLLIPLALTSTNNMMRLLGKKWRIIHRLIYLIAITAIIHFWWLSKVGVYDALPYTLLIFLLLTYRILVKFGIINTDPADNGMEAKEKTHVNKNTEKRHP